MDMTTNFTDGTENAVGAPTRRTIAVYPAYAEAERAVDRLADAKFPVERVAIVGTGIRWVEQVTGRMSYGKAALRGALSGAFAGVLIGWLFGAFDWFDPVVSSAWLALDGLWFGAVVGALIGLLIHAFSGGRRDFESVGTMRADRYEVLVDEEVAYEALRLLNQTEGAPAEAPQAAAPAEADAPAQAPADNQASANR